MKIHPYVWSIPGRLLGSIICAFIFAVGWFFCGLMEGLLFPWFTEEAQHAYLARVEKKREEA